MNSSKKEKPKKNSFKKIAKEEKAQVH